MRGDNYLLKHTVEDKEKETHWGEIKGERRIERMFEILEIQLAFNQWHCEKIREKNYRNTMVPETRVFVDFSKLSF